MAKDGYTGDVCYVGHDQLAADGRQLEGGWHYTVVEAPRIETKDGGVRYVVEGTMPGEKLYLDPDTGEYRLAKDGDESWHARHHERLNIVAPEGNIGEPHDKESVEATLRHLDRHERRLGRLDPHEDGHLLSTPQEIEAARRWLKANPHGVRR